MLDEKDLKQIADLMNMIIENQVTPKFNMMAEMLMDLKEEIRGDKTAARLDEAEEHLEVHEAVIRRHSAEIEQLKKAQ